MNPGGLFCLDGLGLSACVFRLSTLGCLLLVLAAVTESLPELAVHCGQSEGGNVQQRKRALPDKVRRRSLDCLPHRHQELSRARPDHSGGTLPAGPTTTVG